MRELYPLGTKYTNTTWVGCNVNSSMEREHTPLFSTSWQTESALAVFTAQPVTATLHCARAWPAL